MPRIKTMLNIGETLSSLGRAAVCFLPAAGPPALQGAPQGNFNLLEQGDSPERMCHHCPWVGTEGV